MNVGVGVAVGVEVLVDVAVGVGVSVGVLVWVGVLVGVAGASCIAHTPRGPLRSSAHNIASPVTPSR